MKRLMELYPHSFQFLGITLFIYFLAGCDSVRTTTAPLPPGVGRITFYSQGIYVINSNGIGLAQLAESGTKPTWSPDGQLIAFVGRDLEIYVMNADGSDQTRLSNTNNTLVPPPAWSLHDRQIIFSTFKNEGMGSLYLLNVEDTLQGKQGNNPKRLNRQGVDAQSITWSPDGRQIAFSYRPNIDSPNEIAILNVEEAQKSSEGSDWTILSLGSNPNWSPDGRKIAFDSNLEGPVGVYLMDMDGSNQKHLITNLAAGGPVWSPDGQHIAFIGNSDNNPEIYLMNADGSNQTRLTNSPTIDLYPSWSPDGQYITFVSDRDGNQEIYVMNADGSNQLRLTNTPEDEWNPVWQPQ